VDNVVKIFDNTFEYIPSDKGLNYIVCNEYSEIFFGVYQVIVNGVKFIGEGVDTIKGSPIVKIPVIIENETHDVLFALKSDSNNPGVVININSLSTGRKILVDEKNAIEHVVEEQGLDTIEEIVDIDRYKKDALRVITENFNDKKAKLESLQESLQSIINDNVESLKQSTLSDLQEFKSDVISSVETIVESNKIVNDSSIAEINSLKEHISVLVNSYIADLELTSTEKVAALNDLKDQVNFEVSTKLLEFESEVNSYKQITEDEFKKLEKYIIESEENLLAKNQSSIEVNQKLLDTIVEKSNNIVVLVESKISSLQSFTDKKTANIAKAIERKLADFDNKTKIVDEKIDLIEKTLSEKVVDYIDEFTAAVNEKVLSVDIIKAGIESAGETQTSKIQQVGEQLIEAVETKVKNVNIVAVKKEDLSSLKKQLEDRINTESANLKKYVTNYGGGGSVAQQYAAGGTMNGTLNIASGQILSGGIDLIDIFSTSGGGTYLPLSGGTVTGTTIFTGTISATLIEATSANITVIDIKQYELSGFNVQGNATVQGTVSASGLIYASGSNSDNWNSTYSTVQSNSSTWTQSISFNENTAQLSISNSNTVSLSALSGGIVTPPDPIPLISAIWS